jgi:hypothetical protein
MKKLQHNRSAVNVCYHKGHAVSQIIISMATKLQISNTCLQKFPRKKQGTRIFITPTKTKSTLRCPKSPSSAVEAMQILLKYRTARLDNVLKSNGLMRILCPGCKYSNRSAVNVCYHKGHAVSQIIIPMAPKLHMFCNIQFLLVQ